MNGAATGEAAARMINADNITSTINIGANQNFFLIFKKSQNSPSKDILVFLLVHHVVIISELLFISFQIRIRVLFSFYPIRFGRWVPFPVHRIFAYNPHHESGRSQY